MTDGPDLSPAVAAAYEAVEQGLPLSDPGVTESILRPWLESLAARGVGDSTMAALVAQQVLVDLGLRVFSDFPSAVAMQQWLEVRVTQTVGLFTGMMAPPPGQAPPPKSGPQWRWGLLGIPFLGRLPKFGTFPWLVGGAASTALATGLAAITLTATFPAGIASVPTRAYPAQLPPPPTAQLLLPSPAATNVAPLAPKESATPNPKGPSSSSVSASSTEPVARKSVAPTAVVTTSPGPTSPKPTPVPTKKVSPPPPTPPPTSPPTPPPTPPTSPPPTPPPSPPPHHHCHPPRCWQHGGAGVQSRGPNCCPGPPFGLPQTGDPDDRGQQPCSSSGGHPGPWGHKPWLGQSNHPPSEPAKQ